MKDPAYVDVQNGADYLYKLARYAGSGYTLNIHVNGQSKKGYLLALAAVLVGGLCFRPALITFHGGVSQQFFPRPDSLRLHWAFKLLFHLAGGIACDSNAVKDVIASYGVNPNKIQAIQTFSSQYLDFQPAELGSEIENFLRMHSPVFFSYVSFRPEYRLEVLRAGMSMFRTTFSQAGFVWLGFPNKEMPSAREYVAAWRPEEQQSLLLLGNLEHNQFLTLLNRCAAYVRTPACDGVSASVLESLALGIPVIASENGSRPSGVITYPETDAQALCNRMLDLIEHRQNFQVRLDETGADNVGRMADWLCGNTVPLRREEVTHAI
jgi:glycosyltransferase involved in cell wall biosynthesis